MRPFCLQHSKRSDSCRQRYWITALAGLVGGMLVVPGGVAESIPVTEGLAVWLSADALEVAEGEMVGVWPDASGQSHDARAGDAERRPTVVRDAEGRAVVRFDGLAESAGGDVLRTGYVPSTEMTGLVVFRRGTQTSEGSLHRPMLSSGTIGTAGRQRGVGLMVDREPSSNRIRAELGSAPASLDFGINDGQLHLAAVTVRRGADGWTVQLNLDGVDLPDMASADAPTYGELTVGGGDDASLRGGEDNSRFFAGDLAEVVVYGRALAPRELHDVGVWLSAKHGLDAGAWPATLAAAEQEPPIRVRPGLFDAGDPPRLGRPMVASETFAIFHPEGDQPKFNHQVKVYGFGDYLYAHWQAAARDEDASDSHVLYSRSADGQHWSPAEVMAPPVEGKHIRSSGGWWGYGGELTCFFTFPSKPGVGRVTEIRTSRDGVTWTPLEDGILDASLVGNPTALDDGTLVGVFLANDRQLRKPGTRIMTTTDPTGRSGWTVSELPWASTNRPRSARGVEPAIFKQSDGNLVCIFRDMHGSFRSLASISTDGGRTWSTPTLTDLPDSGSMQSAGNLPDGSAYVINVPRQHTDVRVPLAITLSDDGKTFDRAFIIRDQVPGVRFEGKEKFAGYSYPHSWVWKDHLYVVYATSKESVDVTRIRLTDLR